MEALLFGEGNDEFYVAVAKNVEEASKFIGFECVTGE